MDYPLYNVDIEHLLQSERARGFFVAVCSYDSLPALKNGQFCIANTDNIYPLHDPVEGGHHSVCAERGELVLLCDSFGRPLSQMEADYTEPNLRRYFLQAYPNHTIVTNTQPLQESGTGVCGRYAVLVGCLFTSGREGSVSGILKHLGKLFPPGQSRIQNDDRILVLVPFPTLAGGGGGRFIEADSGYASDPEENRRPNIVHLLDDGSDTSHLKRRFKEAENRVSEPPRL